jgi:hypothetical protein
MCPRRRRPLDRIVIVFGGDTIMNTTFADLPRSQLTDDDARRTEEAARYGQVDAVGCGGCT